MKLSPVGSNQTEVETNEYLVLFSYKTPVAAQRKTDGKFFRTDKKWSMTTSKHINQWLEGVTAEHQPQEFFDKLV